MFNTQHFVGSCNNYVMDSWDATSTYCYRFKFCWIAVG